MDEQARGYAATPVAQMADLGEAMFRYWTEDEFATLFRQMLTVEQYRTPELGALYRRYFIETPARVAGEAVRFHDGSGRVRARQPKAAGAWSSSRRSCCSSRPPTVQPRHPTANALVDLARQHVTRFGERHRVRTGRGRARIGGEPIGSATRARRLQVEGRAASRARHTGGRCRPES